MTNSPYKLTHDEAAAILLAHTPGITGFDTAPYSGKADAAWHGLTCPNGHDIAPRVQAVKQRPQRGVCVTCAGKAKHSDESVLAFLREVNPHIVAIDGYTNSNKKMTVVCDLHGDSVTTLTSVRYSDIRPCSKCPKR